MPTTGKPTTGTPSGTPSETPTGPAPSPVPDAGPAWAQRAERWLRHDSRVRQSVVVAVIAVGVLAVAGPSARPELRPVTWLLAVANLAVLAVRVLPAGITQRSAVVPFFVVGAVLAGAVLAVDRTNITCLFAYLLAGQAGYRLAVDRAIGIGVLISLLATVGLAVGNAAGWTDVPFFTGLFTGLPVLLGITRRSRAATEAALRDAAEARVRAAEAEGRAEASAERARIAREVHDVLAHSLAGLHLQLEVVDALLEHGDAVGARAAAARAQGQVRAGMTEVAQTVRTLRADAPPLVDTARAVVDTAAPPGTEVAVTGTPRQVPAPVALTLTRALQEALTNAAKHAPGAPVRVTLEFAPGTVALDVVNGRPSRPAVLAETGSGLGLLGLRERVELVGGRVRTGPPPDGSAGWVVHVTVPM